MPVQYKLPGAHVRGKVGGARPGAGRKKSLTKATSRIVSVLLCEADLEYLSRWGASPSLAFRRMLDRSRLLWPKGE